jgi:hypothetical protein
MAKKPAENGASPVDADAQALLDQAAASTEGDSSTALAPQHSTAIGDFDADPEDIVLPPLNVAYGVGKFVEGFVPGDLILDENYCIAHKNSPPLHCIVIRCDKRWREELPWDPNSGRYPRYFASRDEVVAAGLSLEYQLDPVTGKRHVGARPCSTMDLLIAKPEGLDCPLFSIPLDGIEYAPARWSVDKASWSRAAQPVLSAMQTTLAVRGYVAGRWGLTTKIEEVGGNPVPMPYLKLVGWNTAKFIEDFYTLFSGQRPKAALAASGA